MHLQVQARLPLPKAPTVAASGQLIEFQTVSLRYGAQTALDEISLSIDAGELIAIVGPSGAGKTSTLRLLQGQIRPTSGRLWIDGVPIHGAWAFRLRRLRRRIGVVFQDYRLLSTRSALENVAFALQVSDLSVPRSEARHRAAEQLSLVGLSNRMKARPGELSGGQQQRLAVARALVTRPRILLADEPTASLDENQAKRVLRLFKEISDSGTTVLLATHDRTLISGSGARMVRLSNGRLVGDRRSRGRLWVVG
jgi:cell division transport system ATP-binding protein